uniref:Type III potassium channel toxin protein n=1 Tax=Anemonia sulcata TaxID=6108 RepID=A0A0S1M1A2_ANESU|nr:type III potassium channel toxin protein [Anemonia sulcata]
MSSRLFLLVVLAVLVVTSVAMDNDEENNLILSKRSCLCKGQTGIFYLSNKEGCPSGMGYKDACVYRLGSCCI